MPRFAAKYSAVARLGLCICAAALLSLVSVRAQTECSVAQIINYPINTDSFQLVQDFSVASPRHQGRYHTGEDWFGGHLASLGHPVRAAAAGLVTYSGPTGWGRDGGVVIIRHTFPDGTILYSQYGHMAESETVTFPPRLTCVEAGDIIGVVGDVRPAPHLHFEIRVNQPDDPGPGYTWETPSSLGWRQPARTVTNTRARLNPAYRWHVTTSTFGPAIPPLALNDNSLMLVDGQTLKRITADGHVLWQMRLDRQPVSIPDFQGSPLLIYADGSMTQINLDGTAVERWSVDFRPDMPALRVGETPVFHTADNALFALTPDYRAIRWRLEGAPAYDQSYTTGRLAALVIDDMLWIISHDGEPLNQMQLRGTASISAAQDGTLVVYAQDGLWRIDTQGQRSAVLADAPSSDETKAVTVTDDGRIYLLDGGQLYAYSADGNLTWDATLPEPVTGQASMTHYGSVLLVTSAHGNVVAAQDSGGICGFTRFYGNDHASHWHDLGADGILRVAAGDQIVALDWQRFTHGC